MNLIFSNTIKCLQFSSVQFSHLVVSDSLWPHELQRARPPCPSPTPGVYRNSCPSSRWCRPAISSSVVPFSHLQSFPAWRSFPVSQFFPSGGQSIGTIVPGISAGQNTGMGSLSLLQGIFPTQRLNPVLLHCRRILYQLSHLENPIYKCCPLKEGEYFKLIQNPTHVGIYIILKRKI